MTKTRNARLREEPETPPWELLKKAMQSPVRSDKDTKKNDPMEADELAKHVRCNIKTIYNILRGITRYPRNLNLLLRAVLGSEDHPRARKIQKAYDGLRARKRSADCYSRPVPPDRCYGREPQVTQLIQMLEGGSSAVAAILGPLLVGKTTLAREVAASPPLCRRFKKRRYSVCLRDVTDSQSFHDAIARALGFEPRVTTFDAILKYLGRAQTLLVLDNLETPWEQERALIEAALKSLAALPKLSLLVSMRGTEAPSSPVFSPSIVLDALLFDDALRLLCDIAPNISPDDPYAQPFVEAFRGMPSVLAQMAYRAASEENLQELWEEWQKRGLELATSGNFPEDGPTSLPDTIKLSLRSPRLQLQGQRLLKLLAHLPGGVTQEDRVALVGDDAYRAQHQLRAVGLATSQDGILSLSPYIQKFIGRRPNFSGDEVRHLVHYFVFRALYLVYNLDLCDDLDSKQQFQVKLQIFLLNLEELFLQGLRQLVFSHASNVKTHTPAPIAYITKEQESSNCTLNTVKLNDHFFSSFTSYKYRYGVFWYGLPSFSGDDAKRAKLSIVGKFLDTCMSSECHIYDDGDLALA